MEFKHISVLLSESVDLLDVKPDGVYADGTLGGGGHSSLICSRLSVLTVMKPRSKPQERDFRLTAVTGNCAMIISLI